MGSVKINVLSYLTSLSFEWLGTRIFILSPPSHPPILGPNSNLDTLIETLGQLKRGVQLCKKRQKNWYGFLVPNNEIRNRHLLQLGANWKKNKYNFIINFLQYSGAQIFFYNNSKNDSNFVAALHMVQKEENQKAVRQTYV